MDNDLQIISLSPLEKEVCVMQLKCKTVINVDLYYPMR
jgi:hypothetical protein